MTTTKTVPATSYQLPATYDAPSIASASLLLRSWILLFAVMTSFLSLEKKRKKEKEKKEEKMTGTFLCGN